MFHKNRQLTHMPEFRTFARPWSRQWKQFFLNASLVQIQDKLGKELSTYPRTRRMEHLCMRMKNLGLGYSVE